jgi:hypothetical protein
VTQSVTRPAADPTLDADRTLAGVNRLSDLIADLAEVAARVEAVLAEAEDLGGGVRSSGGLAWGMGSGGKAADDDPTGEAATSHRLARIRGAARFLRRRVRAAERELTRGLAAVESAILTAYDPDLQRTLHEIAEDERATSPSHHPRPLAKTALRPS